MHRLQLRLLPARVEIGVDFVGENDQAQAVPLPECRAGHQDRRFEHGVELRSVAAERRERPAGIDQEHDLLMPLDLEVPADRPRKPRRRLPVHPANVVLRAVFPQRFERRAGACATCSGGFPPAAITRAALPARPPWRSPGAADRESPGAPAAAFAARPGPAARESDSQIAKGDHAALGRN